MVKIGPAFSDSVTPTKGRRRRNISNIIPEEIVSLAPIILLVLAFAVLLVRLFYVQIVRGEYYAELSDSNRTRTELIQAPRGIIFDRANRPLTANKAAFRVGSGDSAKYISEDEALKRIANGQEVNDDIRREYLYKSAFAHVVGYVGQISENESMLPQFTNYGISDMVGKIGLEKEYENKLHGINGKKLFEVNASGTKIRELGSQEPVSGQNIKTTLDIDIQKSVFDAMESVKKGAVVVSDPRDGSLLALYSAPTFDPNVFTYGDEYQPDGGYQTRDEIINDNTNMPLLDRAVAGVYPPGSTFKLVTAIAALQEGAIDKSTIIEDTGQIKVGGATFGNWYYIQYGRKEGPLDIVRAVARSNDIFFYKTAGETGVDKISSWANTFNLGRKTGIDLPGEIGGTVPTIEWKKDAIGEDWYLGDTYNYGIGQGYLLATPLQVNMFTNVFANEGTLYKPHLVVGETKKLEENFVDKKNVDLIREGMRESCDAGGVAFPFFNFSVNNPRLPIDNKNYTEAASASAGTVRIQVGCKTGTAETGGKDVKPHAWITVFAPFYNPEISVTVLVENGGEGSSVAGPIAEKILEDYFKKK